MWWERQIGLKEAKTTTAQITRKHKNPEADGLQEYNKWLQDKNTAEDLKTLPKVVCI